MSEQSDDWALRSICDEALPFGATENARAVCRDELRALLDSRDAPPRAEIVRAVRAAWDAMGPDPTIAWRYAIQFEAKS